MVTETASRAPAACRVSVNNGRSGWCGSGTVNGYDTVGGVDGAWALSNAHVLPKVGQKGTFKFHMPGGRDQEFEGSAKFVAYSQNYQIDWAFAFIPGLTADSGIKPIKLSKARPVGRRFQQTGSPRCVWPLTSTDCTLQDIIQSQRVYRWLPKSIGGQSGSSLRSNSNQGLVELLLTWSWGRYGAGQPTYLIWVSQQTKSSEVGFLRVPGLVEVSDIADRGLQPGYFEEPSEMSDRVQDLPVWEGDPDPGDDPEDPTEPTDPPSSKGVPVDMFMSWLQAREKLDQAMLAKLAELPASGEAIVDPEDDQEPEGITFDL